MAYSKHIGRVGALAVALGIGIGAAPGLAGADDTSPSIGSSARADETGQPSGDRDRRSSRATKGSGRDAGSLDRTAADARTDDSETATPNDRRRMLVDQPAETQTAPTVAAAPEDTESTVDPAEAASSNPAADVAAEPVTAPPAEHAVVDAAVTVPQTPEPATPAEESVPVTVTPAIATLLSPTGPDAPIDSPTLWVLLAAARRQIGQLDARMKDSTARVQNTALLDPQQALDIRRVGDVSVGLTPTDVVATNTRAYVANSAGNSITVLDTVNGAVLQTIALTSSPTRLAVNDDGTRLYVSSAQAGTVSVINTDTSAVIKTIRVGDVPTGIVISPTGNRVYVVNSGDGTVSKISTVTNRVVGTVRGVGEGLSSIAVSANGSKIYVTSHQSGDISYFSSLSTSAKKIVGVTSGSLGLVFNADGSRLFVADPAGSVQVIDTASHQVVDAIDVAGGKPFSLAVNPEGTMLFVAKSDDGTLSVYDLATKAELVTLLANPYVPGAGPSLAITPDGLQLFLGDPLNNRVQIISLIGPNATPVAQTPVVGEPSAAGVVTGSVVVTDADGHPLTYTVSQPGKGSVKVTQKNGTFSFAYTPTAAARHAAAVVGAAAAAKQDTFTLTVSDGHRGVVTVPITVTIRPANAVPKATFRARSSLFTANVAGTVIVRDADRDTITFSASQTAKGGTVKVDVDGKFTYTPTAAARHAAAAADATAADRKDTFTVTVDDGHGGIGTVTVTVKVKPGNLKPFASVRTRSSLFSAAVHGKVTARDWNRDALTYAVSTAPTAGDVTLDPRGNFTYTPTAAARHAAAATGATDTDKQDSFAITVDDGHGGRTTVVVKVKIKPLNTTPARPTVSALTTALNSGAVTGRVAAVDGDGDALTFRAPAATGKGSVTIGADGSFTYTPTAAAREAASRRFAPAYVKRDSFTVVVDDGHGGVRTVTVRVPIAPVHVNQSPTGGSFSTGEPDALSGKVIGSVTATDPEGDTLTFSALPVTPKGSVLITSKGSFVYTPSDVARQRVGAADATEADKIDSFTVTVHDGYGGTLGIPVTVPIVGLPNPL